MWTHFRTETSRSERNESSKALSTQPCQVRWRFGGMTAGSGGATSASQPPAWSCARSPHQISSIVWFPCSVLSCVFFVVGLILFYFIFNPTAILIIPLLYLLSFLVACTSPCLPLKLAVAQRGLWLAASPPYWSSWLANNHGKAVLGSCKRGSTKVLVEMPRRAACAHRWMRLLCRHSVSWRHTVNVRLLLWPCVLV